jgi:hypothetical protein
MKYACVVKNNEGTWDIYRDAIPNNMPETQKERIAYAVNSGIPIFSKDLTQYRDHACSGAVWNGAEWNGGERQAFPEEYDWDHTKIYGYVCNDMIITAFLCIQPSHKAMYGAIFEEETTIIKIPEGQTAKIGDIWNGEQIISV